MVKNNIQANAVDKKKVIKREKVLYKILSDLKHQVTTNYNE